MLFAGDDMTFHCTAVPSTSNEFVDWSITRPNQQEERLPRSQLSSTHTVHNVSRDSEGIYSCHISNTTRHEGCIVIRGEQLDANI